MAGKNPPFDVQLVDLLANRAPSDALPSLLEVARRQAGRKRPADLLRQRENDAFVGPSGVDLRTALELDRIALGAIPEFEALLLSPLTPLGVCSVVSPTSQDRAVATIRGTEVVSDPTNVLAVECARRLAAKADRVRLCTVHQVVRPQRFKDAPGFSHHFRLLALAEAGMATAEHGFEVRAVVDHVVAFQRIFDAFEAHGHAFPARKLTLHVAPGSKTIGDRIHGALKAALPSVPLVESVFESNYYAGIRVLSGANDASGAYSEIADTGIFDWMAKLTSNKKTRFVASGLGIQLVSILFARR